MKKMNSIILFVFLLAPIFFLTGCVSLTGFETGRTVGKHNGEFGMSVNLNNLESEGNLEGGNGDVNYFGPFAEVGGKYGVTERFDIGLRATTALNLIVDSKFQVLGDRMDRYALALGASVSTIAVATINDQSNNGETGVYNFHVPLFMSLHSKNNYIHYYLNPRYIRQFGVIDDDPVAGNSFGANTGILFGRKIQFGLDIGYYRVKSGERSGGVFQAGLGLKFHFDND